MTYDLLLRNGEIVLPGEGRVAGSVVVKGGALPRSSRILKPQMPNE